MGVLMAWRPLLLLVTAHFALLSAVFSIQKSLIWCDIQFTLTAITQLATHSKWKIYKH
jgi:hypothetical protein